MKLSEAIRLGSTLRPQCKGELRAETKSGWGSCALGAAFEAEGCPSGVILITAENQNIYTGLRGLSTPVIGTIMQVTHRPKAWNKVFMKSFHCPVCGVVDQGRRMIPHLNDEHDWTRPAIADWVQTLEAKPRKKKIPVETAVKSV